MVKMKLLSGSRPYNSWPIWIDSIELNPSLC
jgi:hypothetical protein